MHQMQVYIKNRGIPRFINNDVGQRWSFHSAFRSCRRCVREIPLRVIFPDVGVSGEQDCSDRHSANSGEEFALRRVVLLDDGFFWMKWVVEHSDYFK